MREDIPYLEEYLILERRYRIHNNIKKIREDIPYLKDIQYRILGISIF